uniref:Asl1-like glycosyl hydrolase catalytic domain-containing protein n=1 Tax=Alexandrium monilatum TaxID=311494 RepID=A0A7S4UGI8_9DINO
MGLCNLMAAWLALLLGRLGLRSPSALDGWTRHSGVNCYSGKGATDLEAHSGHPYGTVSLEECKAACESLDGCQGVVVSWSIVSVLRGKVVCYRRGSIQLDQCLDHTLVFDLWTRAPSPPPGVPGTYGCGVAIAGDWPNCGAQFSEQYAFDLGALMRKAQNVVGAGQPLWRYDWRSTQHPTGGPWTYVAMDWCPSGGKNEHPDPNGPSPGLMGWNEPNVPGQCNQDAGDSKAVGEFVALARRFKQVGKFVVSPAPSLDPQWLDTFLGVCSAQGFFGVDYLAYHHYVTCNDDTSGNSLYGEMSSVIESFIALMNKWNGRGFGIKGLWITEIACAPVGGWGNLPYRWALGKPALLMEKFIDIQRNYPELKTWSWFGYGGFGNLWDQSTSALTSLGNMYFSHCHPTRAGGNRTAATSLGLPGGLVGEALREALVVV